MEMVFITDEIRLYRIRLRMGQIMLWVVIKYLRSDRVRLDLS